MPRPYARGCVLFAAVTLSTMLVWGPPGRLGPTMPASLAQRPSPASPLEEGEGGAGSGKTVHVWATGGIGNRLGSIVNALWLADCVGGGLRVYWLASDECQVPFATLFEVVRGGAGGAGGPRRIDIVVVAGDPRRVPGGYDIAAVTPKHRDAVDARRIVNARETDLAISGEFIEGVKRGSTRSILYINDRVAHGMQKARVGELLRGYLRPSAAVRWKVKEYLTGQTLPEGVIGVHLRGTDAAHEADVARVVAAVRTRYPREAGHASLFVCSDSAALETQFLREFPRASRRAKRAYPERIDAAQPFRVVDAATGHRVVSNIRRGTQSTVDALVDLLLLARTTLPDPRLDGTYPSSFSDFAAFLKGVGVGEW